MIDTEMRRHIAAIAKKRGQKATFVRRDDGGFDLLVKRIAVKKRPAERVRAS